MAREGCRAHTVLGLLLLAGAPSCCRARECGQAEIDARDITDCSTVLHMKHLGHQGAVWLGDALHHNPHLEFLDLHHTNIGDDDAISLANGLHNNTFLKRLAMHNNRITDVGATAIGAALAHNNALEFLTLSSNGVGDKGAMALADGLRANSAVRRLDLYFNLVGDVGATALARALEVNTALRTLHLDTNSVGEEGGLALARALAGGDRRSSGWFGAAEPTPEAKVFGELTLLYNHLTNPAAEALMDAAKSNGHVHRLAIGHNSGVDGDTGRRLRDEHVPRMDERLAVATWIASPEAGLLPDGWHDPAGPPLATPYAAAVAALRLHTRDGLLALRHDDDDALRARPSVSAIADGERRERLVRAIRDAVTRVTSHDEL